MFWVVEEERLREWGEAEEEGKGIVACQTPREGPQVTALRKHLLNIELDEHQKVLALPGACVRGCDGLDERPDGNKVTQREKEGRAGERRRGEDGK